MVTIPRTGKPRRGLVLSWRILWELSCHPEERRQLNISGERLIEGWLETGMLRRGACKGVDVRHPDRWTTYIRVGVDGAELWVWWR